MKRIAVFCSGSGSNLQSILDACDQGHVKGEVVAVFANRSRAYALERARERGIQARFLSKKKAGSDEAYDEIVLENLNSVKPDLVVMAGALIILGPKTLKAYEGKIINIHPALLPAFGGMGMYGIHVHEAVVASGVRVSGATVHFVNGEVDGGPIILQGVVPVRQEDTPEALQERVLNMEHRILPEAVRLFCEDRISIQGKKVMIRDDA